jgi:hypothetical protein
MAKLRVPGKAAGGIAVDADIGEGAAQHGLQTVAQARNASFVCAHLFSPQAAG